MIDNTGVFKTREDLGRHLGATTARQVPLTAPAKGDVPNVVYGINEHEINDATDVSCAASCTTNAAAPILDVMNRVYGISSGHFETVHAYTNDQNLIDNFHKAERRGRRAVELGHHVNGCCEGGGKGDPRTGRQANGQRHSRTDTER